MKYFIPLIAAAALQAQSSLPLLIDSAQKNERMQSLEQRLRAADLNLKSANNSYLPRVDAFANGSVVDRMGGFDAKGSVAAGLKAEMIVFDGYKREHTIRQNESLRRAAAHTLSGEKKAVSLEVIQRYFELQNSLDEIATQNAMCDQLSAQLVRLEKFRSAGLASEDALMRIRSALSQAQYVLEDLAYQAERVKGELEILSGQTISDLSPALIVEPSAIASEEPDTLKALRFSRDAKAFEAQKADPGFLPTLTIEDQYGYYDYYNDPIAAMRVSTQNKLTASLNLNLIDFSTASTASQALAAQAQAQSSELAYAAKELQNDLSMAKRAIQRSRSLIVSAQSTLASSTKTYEAVKQKYEARIVDYVTYLDALQTLTDATNSLLRAKRGLLGAYASYYYYSGLDPKEFVQ